MIDLHPKFTIRMVFIGKPPVPFFSLAFQAIQVLSYRIIVSYPTTLEIYIKINLRKQTCY